MDHHKDQTHQELNNLVFTIDPHKPTPWQNIVNRIKPFIRCRKGCFENRANHQPSQSSPSQTKQSCIRTGPRYTTIDSDCSSKRNSSECYLLSLPPEIFLEIFSWVARPYELEAGLFTHLRGYYHPILLVFFSPRTWKSMRVFHICKAFRNVAIEFYGQPRRDLIPFNSVLDRVVIGKFLTKSDISHLLLEGTEWREAYLQQRSWIKPKSDQIWFKEGHDYCYTMLPDEIYRLARPHHPIQDLFRRIKHADLSTLATSTYDGSIYSWSTIFRCINPTFPSLETLRILLYSHDDCGKTRRVNTSEPSYKAQDAWLFEGLCQASANGFFELQFKDFFRRLRRLEVLKVRDVCSDVLNNPDTHGPRKGNWLFKGQGDGWDIMESYQIPQI